MTPFILIVSAQLAFVAQAETSPAPPVHSAPAEAPPVVAPPVDAPPVDVPPVEAEQSTITPIEPIVSVDEAPSGPRFYVVDPHVVNMPDAVQRSISSAIAQALQDEGLSTFTRDDVREIFGQMSDLAVLDADADQISLASLGEAVGAKWLVAAVVTKLDDGDVSVQMRLIEVSKGTAAARRETRASDFGGDILAATKDATRLVLAPLFAHLKGKLTLVISEEGADVLIDGQQIGVSPIDSTIPLPGGHHVLTVAKSGFIRHQETLKVENAAALTRDVAMRPSRDFLLDYQSSNELFRTLAWTTTGGALALAGVGVGFGVGWFLKDQEAVQTHAAVQKEVLERGLNAERDADEIAALERPIHDAQFMAQLFSVVGIAAGAVAVGAGATAAYFWIFGDDPDRYDAYAAEYGLVE